MWVVGQWQRAVCELQAVPVPTQAAYDVERVTGNRENLRKQRGRCGHRGRCFLLRPESNDRLTL